MNILAHLYLSGNKEEIIMGNFIGDFVKGNNIKKYPELVQKGIMVHRNIDSFTDSHSIVRKSKRHVSQKYGKYAGIVIDIFYDHFLATCWQTYHNYSLNEFVEFSNNILINNRHLVPERARDYVDKYVKNKWVNFYKTAAGIERVLNGMATHTSLPDFTVFGIKKLNEKHADFDHEFALFFPQIIEFVTKEFSLEIGFMKKTV